MNTQRMDFLKDKFTDVPDLQEQPQSVAKQRPTKPKKRQRHEFTHSLQFVKIVPGGMWSSLV
jgi:hypothetical protein